MKALKCFLLLSVAGSFIACGANKLIIKQRLSQNPKIMVHYTPSTIGKFPDYSRGAGPETKWKVPIPDDFGILAKNIVLNGLKNEWPGAEISYEPDPANKMNYDLVVWVTPKGTFHIDGWVQDENQKITLKMNTNFTIYNPHKTKNLTGLLGVNLGEVASAQKKINRDSVFTEVIPPISLLDKLNETTAKGLKNYFKEVKAATGS